MEYKLIRSKRLTLCLEIDKAQLIVRAPLYMSVRSIEKYITRKKKWINKHLSKAKKYPQKREDEIMISGNIYKVIINQGSEGLTIADSDVLVVAKNEKQAGEIIKKFLLERTKVKVKKYLKIYTDNFDIQGKKLIFKFYKSKWGSCSGKNTLSFNGALSMCPDEVIDYIVVHELVHIKHKNHSEKYWSEVKRHCPDYKEHRKWLRVNRDMLKI